ncbi:MAG: arabinose polymer transporter [Candidatus Tokpelaia sp. JSC188]|nr:MAG: arabinose polymer transporter [Candidatus Tokpelaia sp. JSC188]
MRAFLDIPKSFQMTTRGSFPILAMAIGSFAIGTGEFVIMGLLPEIAHSLSISIPQAGHAISAYALGVVIGAPTLAVIVVRWERRCLLITLILAFALGNFTSAGALGYISLNILRFVAGVPHGTYFGVAALVAASLSPSNKRATAVGLMMSGLTISTLAGVPLAGWLGQNFGWRSAFILVGSIALLSAVMIRYALPVVSAPPGAGPMHELGGLCNRQVWLTLGISAIGLGGLFSVFSYVKPTMIEVAGMSISSIPVVLALFGIGMVAGNLLGSRLANKNLMPVIGAMLLWAITILGSYSFTAHYYIAGSINVMLIGTIVAVGPALQIRLMDVAGDAQVIAAALHHSAFNIANALGAWLGGLAVDAGLGWTSTGWVGVGLGVGGLSIYMLALADMHHQCRKTV